MKKFRKNFLFLCDEAFMSENGKVNIIGIFERIYSPSLPAVHLKSVLVANFDINDKEISELEVQIDIVDKDKKAVGISIPKLKIPVTIKEGSRKAGILIQLGNLKFDNYGEYKIVITTNGEEIGEYLFEVAKPEANAL